MRYKGGLMRTWIPKPQATTLVVSASNSLYRERADHPYYCDGVADEVEINLALNALPAQGGKVTLLEGTYTLAHPIVIPGDNIVLEGQGWSTLIDGDALPTNEHGIQITAHSFCEVRNLSIQTEDGGGKTCHCIFIEDGSNEFLINRVYFVESDSDAIYIGGTSISKGWIEKCFIEGADGRGIHVDLDALEIMSYLKIKDNWIGSTGSEGIRFGATHTANRNCEIQGNTIASSSDAGIRLLNGDNCNISYNTLSGNHSGLYVNVSTNTTVADNNVHDSTTNDGINVDDSPGTTVSGNTVENNAGYGIQISSASEQSGVTSNTCKGNTKDGILLTACESITVTGNTCVANEENGIQVDYNLNTISGNTCSRNGGNGIYLIGADHNTITGNTCAENSQTADITSDGIQLSASDYNTISHNTIRHSGLAKKHRYGIHISTPTCDKNRVLGNDLYNAGSMGNFYDVGTLTTVTPDNREISIDQVRVYIYAKNTYAGALAAGDVVVLKSVANGNEVTTTVTLGDIHVVGIAAEAIIADAWGYILVAGKTVVLSASNDNGNVAIGDFLCASDTPTEAVLATAGTTAFAMALEACAVANATIDALLINPLTF